MRQQYFGCLEIFFFWQLGSRRANKKHRYFQNDYLGGVETEKLKNLRFVERGLEASGFLIPVVDLPPRPPAFSTKFRLCCCMFHTALTCIFHNVYCLYLRQGVRPRSHISILGRSQTFFLLKAFRRVIPPPPHSRPLNLPVPSVPVALLGGKAPRE
jgi:hypothetical protein